MITGVDGVIITELGFDHRVGTECGIGLHMRLTSGGVVHNLTCADGVPTVDQPDPTNWVRIRYPSVTGLVIDDLRIVLRLPAGDSGVSYVDNLAVNGSLIGKAGGGIR